MKTRLFVVYGKKTARVVETSDGSLPKARATSVIEEHTSKDYAKHIANTFRQAREMEEIFGVNLDD